MAPPRAALYLMPSLAVLATAVLVLGPGRERPVLGARVWGVPAEGARAAAWRIETLERQFGSSRTFPVDGLELTVEEGDRRIAAWAGASGEDGVAEAAFEVPEPFEGPLEVRIARGKTPLAQGVIPLDRPPELAFERHVVEGNAQGEIALEVEIERGVLASPFPGALRVRARRAGQPAPGVVLKATADGAQLLETGLQPTTDANGEARIALQPTWHSVDLHLDATLAVPDTPSSDPAGTSPANRPPAPAASGSANRPSAPAKEPGNAGHGEAGASAANEPSGAGGPDPAASSGPDAPAGGPAKGTWDGALPVKPGAIWVSFDPSHPMLVSPAPRERAYVSGLGEQGRVVGQVVPLVKNASGMFEGALDTGDLARLGVRAITVAGDPQEVGSGTVTWPVDGGRAVASAPRVRMLLDGLPFAEQREKKRSSDARIASIWVALIAAAFEVALLVLHGRASEARLAAHLASVSEDEGDRAAAARIAGSAASRTFTLVVAIGLVVLAFGAIAAFAIVH